MCWITSCVINLLVWNQSSGSLWTCTVWLRDPFLYYNKHRGSFIDLHYIWYPIQPDFEAYISSYAPLRSKSQNLSTCLLSLAMSRTNPQVLDTGLTPQDWLAEPDWESTNRNTPNSLSPLQNDIFSFWPAPMQQRDNPEGKGGADLSSCALKMRVQQVQKGIGASPQPLFALLLPSSHICPHICVNAPKQWCQFYTYKHPMVTRSPSVRMCCPVLAGVFLFLLWLYNQCFVVHSDNL